MNEMSKKSALMMWVGFMLMMLSILLLLMSWVYIQYEFVLDTALLLMALGIVSGISGGILWLIGASRGEN